MATKTLAQRIDAALYRVNTVRRGGRASEAGQRIGHAIRTALRLRKEGRIMAACEAAAVRVLKNGRSAQD